MAGRISHRRIFMSHQQDLLVLSLPFNQQEPTANVCNWWLACCGAEKSADQGVNLTAGKRVAGGERLPLGRPGDLPQGFGMHAELPSVGNRDEKARRRSCDTLGSGRRTALPFREFS